MIRDPSDGSTKEAEGNDRRTVHQVNGRREDDSNRAGFFRERGGGEAARADQVATKRPTSAENWGLKSLDKPERKPTPAPTKEQLEAHYREFGLGFMKKEIENG